MWLSYYAVPDHKRVSYPPGLLPAAGGKGREFLCTPRLPGDQNGVTMNGGLPVTPVIGSLSIHVFETRTTTGRGHFVCQGSGVSQIFIPSISNGEKILGDANAVRVSKTHVLKLPNTRGMWITGVSNSRGCIKTKSGQQNK